MVPGFAQDCLEYYSRSQRGHSRRDEAGAWDLPLDQDKDRE